jgi:hypothetical protein
VIGQYLFLSFVNHKSNTKKGYRLHKKKSSKDGRRDWNSFFSYRGGCERVFAAGNKRGKEAKAQQW